MRALRVLVVLSLVAVQIAAQSAAQVLARLDDVAPKFRTATAKVTWIDYQAAIKTEETQSGTITVKRYSRTKVHYVVRLADPDVYGLALRDNTVERYTPRNNLIQEYDIRRYRDLVQRFMLLGFGMTGRELANAFGISDVRAEAVRSQKATHLDLTPKSPDLLHHVNHIELWISDQLGCAVQQKFHYPDGSYRLVTFTDLKFNPKVDDSAMEFPKSAKRERVY